MSGEEQPSEDKFKNRVGYDRKKSKFSSPGQGWWEKNQNFPHWDQFCLAKTYKFLPKCTHSSPKWLNSSPWWKKDITFLAGAGLTWKNLDFWPGEYLPRPTPDRNASQNDVLTKKMLGLVPGILLLVQLKLIQMVTLYKGRKFSNLINRKKDNYQPTTTCNF